MISFLPRKKGKKGKESIVKIPKWKSFQNKKCEKISFHDDIDQRRKDRVMSILSIVTLCRRE